MSQASNTISPADASRRRFLAVAGAASAVSVGVLAAAAVPLPAPQSDAEIVTAGIQFEALLAQYAPVYLEWARLHCEAQEETEAKFGEDDRDNEAWTKPLTGTSPATIYLIEALEKNGGDVAAEREAALFQQMVPLADLIRESEVTSLAGLRAKTLVTVLDFWPGFAEHDGFDVPENSHYSLFAGAVAVTGLGEFVGDIENRLIAGAMASLRDGSPV